MDRAALVVGINKYKSLPPLKSCVEDARRVQSLLARNADGGANFACEVLLGRQGAELKVTRARLRERLTHLLEGKAQHALFYFAGHATIRHSIGMLVTQEGDKWEEGIPMAEVVEMANDSKISEVTLIIDSCYAGHFGDRQVGGGEPLARLREGVCVLGACGALEEAQEGHRGGLFTGVVCEALGGGAADLRGLVTVASVYDYVDRLLGPLAQRPLFRASVTRLSPLRRCHARVTDAELQRLKEFFKRPDRGFRLDPHYDVPNPRPRGYKADAEKQKKMALLRRYAAAGLLVPENGVPYMWTAAMNSRRCLLTPLGRLYWEMVDQKRI